MGIREKLKLPKKEVARVVGENLLAG